MYPSALTSISLASISLSSYMPEDSSIPKKRYYFRL
jgi:hypothetical protein